MKRIYWHRFRLAAQLGLALSLPGALLAATIHVPGDAPGIQQAIEAAADGDTILVADGVYVENLDFLGKAITVRSENGSANAVIDGGMAAPAVTFHNGEGLQAVLEGFTITNGLGSGEGAGIRIVAASPTVRHNTISYNSGSLYGGVFCEQSQAILDGNAIFANEAPFRGGGIACVSASPMIIGNSITDNVAPLEGGGGIYCRESSPLIRRNHISRNQGPEGGGIRLVVESSPIVEDNVLEENAWSAIYSGRDCAPVIRRNRFAGNRGGSGGAIACVGPQSRPTIEGNEFRENSALAYGGALHASLGAEPRLEGNRFLENGDSLDLLGGAVAASSGAHVVLAGNLFHGNLAGEGAGLFLDADSSALVVNDTFTRNVARRGGAVLAGAGAGVTVVNSILRGDLAFDGSEIFVESGTPAITFSDVEGSWPGEGNFDADPLFVDLEGGDLHLRIGSPCADAGNDMAPEVPATDFEGDPRILNGDSDPLPRIDLGADELRPEAAARFGTVNAGAGPLADVLLVNESPGDLRERRVTVSPDAPLQIDVLAPPGGPDPAPFVMYLWVGEPTLDTLAPQPFGLGVAAFPTPLSDPTRSPQPAMIWNNLGHARRLGQATRPSDPAPSTLVARSLGVGRGALVTLQGLILDGASANAAGASLTNAVVVEVTEGDTLPPPGR